MLFTRSICLYLLLVLVITCCHTSRLFAAPIIVVTDESVNSTAIGTIISGIKEATPGSIVSKPEKLHEIINASDIVVDSLIYLGRDSVELFPLILSDLPSIGGGFTGSVDPGLNLPTLSLEIDPEVIIAEIKKSGFPLSRLWTIATPEANSQLINDARIAASNEDIELLVIDANGERSTARAWFDILQEINPSTDAIWIADDKYLDESGSYRFLSEKAWINNILIISGIPRYAKRGIAIGFIPDLRAHGRELATQISSESNEIKIRQWTNLDTAQRVLNKRTLEHIGRSLPDDLDRLGKDDIVIR